MNKPNFPKLFLATVFILIFSITIYSQDINTPSPFSDSTEVYLIYLKNGKKLKGRILQIENETVTFLNKKKNETTTLLLSEIHQLKIKDKLEGWDKKYAHRSNYSQYLFFTNTAFNIKKNVRNYRTFMGASMLFDYGVTDGFSIGAAYSFPIWFSLNIKVSGTLEKHSRGGWKSNYVTIPVLISSDDGFSVWENSFQYTAGNPDQFFNLAYTNYWIQKDDFFSSFGGYFPGIYHSISLGGGIRLSEKWHFVLENHVNFNSEFVDAKVLPSFGFSYTTSLHNVAFGFHSTNSLGFNSFPIIDFTEDDIAVFFNSFVSRLPFFSYSKFF